MYSTSTLEEIAERTTRWWVQINPTPDVGFNKALIQQAEGLGARAVIVTVDTVVPGPRERQRWNGLDLPSGMSFGILQHYPVDIRPSGGLETIYRPSLDAAFTLGKLHDLIRSTTLPVLVKGVLHPDDARAAVATGAAGVIVSNHGGRNLDTTVAPIEVLASIVDAVSDSVPVLYDGGVRRGTDVLKALAIGARAVLIGRPYLWGLAAAGSAGVSYVIAKILNELRSAMALTGASTIRDLTRDLILQYSCDLGQRRAHHAD
jgi:4-hydroxymandelate oxidase